MSKGVKLEKRNSEKETLNGFIDRYHLSKKTIPTVNGNSGSNGLKKRTTQIKKCLSKKISKIEDQYQVVTSTKPKKKK